MSQTRQLAAIMFTDIVGYTALMGKDSNKALELIRISKEIQKPLVEKHNGKWLKEMGDGAMAQFSTALDAVNCSIEIQKSARAELDAKLRIGIHLGDVTVEEDDVYGDGVNVASRLESIADPGGIYISESIEKAIQGQTDVQAKYLGEIKLKNVAYGVRTYAVQGVGLPVPEVKDEKELSGHFWAELQRRGVLRAGVVYLGVALLLILLLREAQNWLTLPELLLPILITVLVVGFPLAMYFAWNYERSPEGFVRTTSRESWQNPYKGSQRKPLTSNLAILGLILVIIAMYVYPRFLANPSEDSASGAVVTNDYKSIAVLPFKTIGNDPEGEYFAEGVQEEILNHLSRIEDLHVKSRTSVEKFKDHPPTREELSELQLTHYLEGSTRKEGNRILLTVQLIDANTNDHLWTENYDRNYENIWETQSEIAKKIAEALRITISPEVVRVIDKKPTDNPQAWDDYLKARYYWRRFTSLRKPTDLENMVKFLKKSISKDPNFALGYSNLALAYQQQPGDPGIVFDFINPDSVLILCNKAIDLDPILSDPYVTRAEYYAYIDLDTASAARDYRQAISNGAHLPRPYWKFGQFQYQQNWDMAAALKLTFQGLQKQPDSWILAQMLNEIGMNYLEIADYHKAEYYMDKALIYDPDNISFMIYKGQLYMVTGQYDKLHSLADRSMEISPLNTGLYGMGMYYLMIKEYEESIRYFDQYFTRASETAYWGQMYNSHMYGYALLQIGKQKEANEKFEFVLNLIRDRGHPTPDYEYAKIYSAMGMVDSSYYHLERAVSGPIHWGMSDFMERDPLFENIKDEPEFQRLVEIAREKVRLKREEVRKLEESGEIPISLDRIELY